MTGSPNTPNNKYLDQLEQKTKELQQEIAERKQTEILLMSGVIKTCSPIKASWNQSMSAISRTLSTHLNGVRSPKYIRQISHAPRKINP